MDTINNKKNDGQPAAPVPAASPGAVIFENGTQGLEHINQTYDAWSGQLTQRNFELSLAIIAANWAVFGSINGVLGSELARLSVSVSLLGLLLTLVGTWCMTRRLSDRVLYAQQYSLKWEEECKASQGNDNPWPYTEEINKLGANLLLVKTFFPIASGALFFLALVWPSIRQLIA